MLLCEYAIVGLREITMLNYLVIQLVIIFHYDSEYDS